MKYYFTLFFYIYLATLTAQHEVLDSRIPTKPENLPTSEPYHIQTSKFTMVQVNVNKDGKNIVGDAANEPSLAIDQNNPNRMMIGWRQFDDVNNNFRQAGVGISEDGGLTWKFPGVIQPGIFRSDPVLDTDTDGTFYYNSLTLDTANNYRCDVFRSSDLKTWDKGVPAQGGDKQWMIIDKSKSSGRNNIYSFWTKYYSYCKDNNFTFSTNRGNSYEECSEIEEVPHWGNMDFGLDGEVYIADPTFLFVSKDAKNNIAQPTWNTISYPKLGQFAGFVDDSPNPIGLLGTPLVAINRSITKYKGEIYIGGSVIDVNPPYESNVFFVKSENGGVDWSSPIKINTNLNGNNTWHWMATMSVAPNGRIDMAWLDTRDHPDTYLSSLYYSYSLDGGNTWSKNERLTNEFDPHKGWPQQQKMGDYFHAISDNEGMNLAWAATFGDEQNVYFSKITPDKASALPAVASSSSILYQNTPNPASDKTRISVFLSENSDANIKIFNQLGQLIYTFEKENCIGNIDFDWEISPESCGGIYIYELYVNQQFVDRKKLVLVK